MLKAGMKYGRRLAIVAVGLLSLAGGGCAELQTLRERTRLQEDRLAKVRAENDQFQKAYYQIKETLDTELAKYEKEKTQLTRELDQARNLKTQREKELGDSLRSTSLEYEAYRSMMEEAKTSAEGEIRTLKKQIVKQNAELKAAGKQLEQVRGQLREEQQNNQALTQVNAEQKLKLKTLEDRVGARERELAKSEAALKQERAALKKAREETTIAGEIQEANEAEIEELKQQLKEAKAALAPLRAQVASLKKSLKASGDIEKLRQTHKRELEALRKEAGAGLEKDEELAAWAAAIEKKIKTDPALEPLQVKHDRHGLRLILPSDGLFERGAAGLSPKGVALLRALLPELERAAARRIRVEGHTDDMPIKDLPFPHNWALGYARADLLRDWLMSEGQLPGRRMETVSRADQAPIVAEKTDAARGQNRRVEIVIGEQ